MSVEAPAAPPGGRSGDATDPTRDRFPAIVLAVVAATLGMILGYFLKAQCMPPLVWDGAQYWRNCYTDMLPLYGRNTEEFPASRTFAQQGLAYRDLDLEYPALTGLYISSVNTLATRDDPTVFFRLNAFGLALIGVAGAAALAAVARDRRRLALYAVAPSMISYAFLNWDLLSVGFCAFGLWAFVRKKDELAGAMLGLGAAAKIFPGLILPALMIARRREGKRVWPMAAQAVLWFAIPNVVVWIYAGTEGWWFPWKFQSLRGPNWETLWSFLSRRFGDDWSFLALDTGYGRRAQFVSMAMFGAGALWLLYREWRSSRPRPIATGFGLVLLFLLTAKVYSPQYALWLLPFFALVRVPWHAFAVFTLTEIGVTVAIWAFFVAFADGTSTPWNLNWLDIAVFCRYAGLLYVLWWTRRGEDLAGDPVPEPQPTATHLWADQPAV